MGNGKQPPPSGKPPGAPGISPADPRSLFPRVDALEKFVRENFDEKNQWNSLVRTWVGSQVKLRLIDGETVLGVLRWIDRYTLCVEIDGEPAIVHKAALAIIQQFKA